MERISFDEFVDAVDQMMKAQDDYFKTRSGQLLDEAKQHERKVREMIRQHKDRQLPLF